jgi:hypothetical protein
VSETHDLATALIEADVAERQRLLGDADPGTLEAALEKLGRRRETAAADVLLLVEQVVDDRALRKVARRELHRLRSSGIHPSPPTLAHVEEAPARPEPTLEVSEAWATDIDPSGSRALWVLGEPPLGGVWFGALLLNDLRGVLDLSLVDTTRKRYLKDFDDNRGSAGTWISLPGAYALRLIAEAVALTHELDTGLPTRYKAFRDIFGEAPAGPERALVYDTVSPVEANFNPEWLDESQRLLGEPELAGWFITAPAELRSRALEVARGPSAALLVPGHTPEQQALQLLSEAAQAGLTPSVRRAMRRRLEETGYIFVATDRLAAARLAVAAARGLEEPAGPGSGVPPELHPLLRVFLAAGLARLIGTETVGSRRASDVLLELIERSTSERDNQPVGGIETRPSGLIVPR